MYKLVNYPSGVIDLDKNQFYPADPDNTDYQAFLLWKAEGNQPLPADEENT
jgi:hypothetical protein